MNFKKWVKSIQTAGYNGARTVYNFFSIGQGPSNAGKLNWNLLVFFHSYSFQDNVKRTHCKPILCKDYGILYVSLFQTILGQGTCQRQHVRFRFAHPSRCHINYFGSHWSGSRSLLHFLNFFQNGSTCHCFGSFARPDSLTSPSLFPRTR